MNKSNLSSPQQISSECTLSNLNKWIEDELKILTNKHEKQLIEIVVKNLDEFVNFSNKAVLMWEGCDRIVEKGQKTKYHKFSQELKNRLKEAGVKNIDSRANGPAVSAYLFGGGIRPERFGSKNSWHIHHLYSGKFPYLGKDETLHAVKDGLHFTQSAGLVATHPIVDQMCDEYPFFSWYLRGISFKKFRYDPDIVFSDKKHDKYGFIN